MFEHATVSTYALPIVTLPCCQVKLELDFGISNSSTGKYELSPRSHDSVEPQDSKIKTSTNSDIQDLLSRYQDYQDNDCQGRLLASFQDDAKYEHVGQDTRLQGGKDDQD
ncbi:hypothetical protein Tco_0791578 [Tanacetum coccineum]